MLPKIFASIGAALAGVPEKLKPKSAKGENDGCPKILVCGMSGSGKSSLINAVLGGDAAEVGNVGGIREYRSDSRKLLIFETEGCSTNSVGEYRARIKAFLKKNRAETAWYCVSAGSKRFLETDAENVRQLVGLCGAVTVVLTRIDTVSREELSDLVGSVRSVFSGINIVSFSSSPALKKQSEYAIKQLLENSNGA